MQMDIVLHERSGQTLTQWKEDTSLHGYCTLLGIFERFYFAEVVHSSVRGENAEIIVRARGGASSIVRARMDIKIRGVRALLQEV